MSTASKDENLQLPLLMTIILLVQHNNKISPYFLFELETFNSSLNNDVAS